MSINKWGILKETGKLVNIDNLDKSYQGKVVCCDKNCGCDLILNIGAKKDPYFRHPAHNACSGGSAETILHKLAKDVILNSTKLFVPSCQYSAVKDRPINVDEEFMLDLSQCTVFSEQSLKNDVSLIPDVTIEAPNGEFFYVEIYVTHKTNETKIKKYMGLVGDFHVVEIDLRDYKDIDKFSYNELADAICLNAKRTIIASKNLAVITNRVKDAEFYATGDKAICPCQDAIVSTKDCKKCPFYISTNRGTMSCLGKSCYGKASDIEKGRPADELYDIYCEEIPKPIGKIDYNAFKHPIGLCKRCNEPLVLATGFEDDDNYNKGTITPTNTGKVLVGIGVLSFKTGAVYTYCPKCGAYHKLECPVCKKLSKIKKIGYDMRISRNQTKGNVWMHCENYRTGESLKRHGVDLEYGHNYSLSVYTNIPITNNYADEILACDLETFLTKPDKAEKLLSEVRGYDERKGYETKTGIYQR